MSFAIGKDHDVRCKPSSGLSLMAMRKWIVGVYLSLQVSMLNALNALRISFKIGVDVAVGVLVE